MLMRLDEAKQPCRRPLDEAITARAKASRHSYQGHAPCTASMLSPSVLSKMLAVDYQLNSLSNKSSLA